MLKFHLNRKNTIVIIIGGGALGDSVHFVGASLLRGLDVIRIPTTLLSMVDSSVGGKVGINSRKLKNMIGSFAQPKAVFCDANFLLTLTKKELMSGYAEVLKHALIFDKNLFETLEKNIDIWQNDLSNKLDWLHEIIAKNIQIKYHFIKDDEYDLLGLRAILNFGHTVGHAIEKAEGLNYSHGEAVAMGMYVEAKIAQDLGLLPFEITNRIKNHLQKTNLWNLEFLKVNPEYLISLMSNDKKAESDSIIKLNEFYCKETLPIVCLTDIGVAHLNPNVKFDIILKYLNNL